LNFPPVFFPFSTIWPYCTVAAYLAASLPQTIFLIDQFDFPAQFFPLSTIWPDCRVAPPPCSSKIEIPFVFIAQVEFPANFFSLLPSGLTAQAQHIQPHHCPKRLFSLVNLIFPPSFSAYYHLASPRSRGLFHRIIGQSGLGGLSPGFHENPPDNAVRYTYCILI
jgi:hypothetical protein